MLLLTRMAKCSSKTGSYVILAEGARQLSATPDDNNLFIRNYAL